MKAGAGRAGLDRVVAVARDQGLGLAETNIDELAAVLWGTVAQLGGFFAVDLSIY